MKVSEEGAAHIVRNQGFPQGSVLYCRSWSVGESSGDTLAYDH